MTDTFLSGLAGIVLSLAFSYIPGLNKWYDTLSADQKRLVMLGALVVVSAGVVGLACSGFGADFGLSLTCDRTGIGSVVTAFVQALVLAGVTNQTTYLLTLENTPESRQTHKQ